MVKVGDHVLLVSGGVSVFEVVEVEGDYAWVQSLQDAPGKYPFRTPVSFLVPAEPT